ELFADAGLQLSRVGFDERVELSERRVQPGFIDTVITQRRPGLQALDHGWAIAASLGCEGRARVGALGFSLALAGLVPLLPARSDWGDHSSLDTLGAQVRAGVWMLLGT